MNQVIRNILEYLEWDEREYKDKIAFADDKEQCTYGELVKRAKAVGSGLAAYTDPRKPIPVFMQKSVKAVVAFMGTVYAGCFYILLDPKQPSARLRQILERLETKQIVVDKAYETELLKLNFQGHVLYLEDLENTRIKTEVLDQVREQSQDIDPLYGIFTSGSTGIPKGVVISHRSVIDFFECFTDIFHITDKDVIGNQAPFDFDVSVKDIYSTLKAGATMQIIPTRLFSFPAKLLDFICERNITTLIWAVSALCIVTTLKGFDYKIPSKVNKIMFSGEVMPIKHLNLWKKALPDAMYVNLYGPTEITCNCTYYILDREFAPGDALPIGRAFPNEKVFLLDEKNQEITEVEVLGELCVSGTALALGYYNDTEQTSKAFVQNPLNTKYMETIYRTGDLAYYNEKRELVYASRKDFQVKHMGHRIELGEIEASIERVKEIIRNCCVFIEEKNKIIAFYEGDIDKRTIVKKLSENLPAYMIPNGFCQMKSLPVTKNGKIDRNQLKEVYLGKYVENKSYKKS